MIFIKLSEGIFGFGSGGINRIEPVDRRYEKSYYNTILYNNTTKVTAVKETVDEIELLLDNSKQKSDN